MTKHHVPTPTALSQSPSKQDGSPSKHSPESMEWLNATLREVMKTYRSALRDNDAGPEGDESSRAKVEHRLNSMRPLGFVDPILVHSVNLGSSAPSLANARIKSMIALPDAQQLEFDMTYTDDVSISFSTSVIFNYPFPYFARLPVSLTIALSVFSTKILLTPPSPSSPNPTLTLALTPRFTLDLHISSLLGSRAKLADVPKLHDMIESRIKKTLKDHGSWSIVLPGLSHLQTGGKTCHPNDEIDIKLINEGSGGAEELNES